MERMAINLFYSYSHVDSDYRSNMEKHLVSLKRQGILNEWYDRKISAGQKINEEIKKEIKKSDIVVFLISVDFLNSDACLEELSLAKEMASVSNKRLISVIVRHCSWHKFDDLGDYLAIPTDGKPVEDWGSEDKAWTDVFSYIENAVDEVRKNFSVKEEFVSQVSSVEFCSQSENNLSIKDIFVFPNLVEYNDKTEKEERVSSSESILLKNKVLIEGENQSGKTKLLGHIFVESIEKNKNILFVDFNEIAFKTPKIEVLLDVYRKQYCGDFSVWLKANEKILLVDNISNLGHSLGWIDIFENYFEIIVLASSTDDYKSFFFDDDRLVEYSTISIKPFTHVKQEKLIRNWLSSRAESGEISHGKIDRIENNVNSIIIDNKILPRFPFFILSILQTYENFMPQDLKISAYGHCYHALILARLIKSGIDKSDKSLSACFTFASRLAYEIYNKGDVYLTDEEFDQFVGKYKEKFLIKDSLISRICGVNGIIKRYNGRGVCFSLDYSYFFFLGRFFAETYKKNKHIVEEMIDSSYSKNNSLTLIFTIHHAQDFEIVDEILTHTMCLIDHCDPASLNEHETSIFRELLENLPYKLRAPEDVEDEREKERRHRDEADNDSEVVEHSDENGTHKTLINQVFKCYKNMEILSQILKNKSGSIEISKLTEIVEIICDASLRLVKIMLVDEGEIDRFTHYIYKQYKQSRNYDHHKSESEQLIEMKKLYIFRVFIWVMSNIERSVASINKPELKDIVLSVAKRKNSPAYDLINYFYTLDTADSLGEKEKALFEEMYRRFSVEHKSIFIPRILSIRTQHYLNTHDVKAPIRQSVCSTLGITYKHKP